jgi:hypothetical protein
MPLYRVTLQQIETRRREKIIYIAAIDEVEAHRLAKRQDNGKDYVLVGDGPRITVRVTGIDVLPNADVDSA